MNKVRNQSTAVIPKNAKKIRLNDYILPCYRPVWNSSKDSEVLYEVLKGGRNSGKSFFIPIILLRDLIKYPISVLCVRKVGNTLSDSCFEQFKNLISLLDLDKYFRAYVNPLKIIYLPRGNSILFRGADDPAKIKSINQSRFPLARLWVEEIAEFQTEREVSTIVNSVIRAELEDDMFYKVYYSYNPPRQKNIWLNVKFNQPNLPKNTKVYHTTYLDNPYVSEAFKIEAETVKKTDPNRYRWEYLGDAIGSGVVPFDNLTFREITDEEISQFDNIKQGADFGYSVDPFAFVRLHYDKTRRKIYIFDEIYGIQLFNKEIASMIKDKGYNDVSTYFDSAEPKSIDEIRQEGVLAERAIKGKGSVEFGEKFLGELIEIVIDSKRCPNTAREFANIDFAVDRWGNTLPRLQDKDNHSIDATRYALSHCMLGSVYEY